MAFPRTIDITTTGRRTGERRRIEIWWFRIGDRFVITGTPGRRDWLANVRADPRMTLHLPAGDVDVTATEITDAAIRAEVIDHPDTSWYVSQAERGRLIGEAPMIELRAGAVDLAELVDP